MEFRGIMGGFYRISEWIMRFSAINLLWVICSFPVFFLLLTGLQVQSVEEMYSILILMAALSPFTLIPASAAMFAVARKWVTGNEDVPLFKTYFISFKENYVASMLGGLIYMLLGIVLIVNYRFYLGQEGNLKLLSILFVTFGAVLFASMFNFLCIQVHLHMKLLQVVKNSILITIGQPVRTILMMVSNGFIIWVSFFQFTFLIPFFMGSLIAYLTFWHFHMGFVKIQEKMAAAQEKTEAEAGGVEDADKKA